MREGRPIVAFESACWSHPQYIFLLKAQMERCRARGVMPALVLCVDGVLTIGATVDTLDACLRRHSAFYTLGVADIAIAMQAGWSGSVTAAAAISMARLAGIRVCAVGMIGGGMRHGNASTANTSTARHDGADNAVSASSAERLREVPSVSADLYTLARCPVAVISTGLFSADADDSHRHLVALPISVVGFRCAHYPHFAPDGWSAQRVRVTVKEVAEIAAVLHTIDMLNQQHAVLAFSAYSKDDAQDTHARSSGNTQANERNGVRSAAQASEDGATQMDRNAQTDTHGSVQVDGDDSIEHDGDGDNAEYRESYMHLMSTRYVMQNCELAIGVSIACAQ